MMENVIAAMRKIVNKPFAVAMSAINCHHNYVQKEMHFNQAVFITRKGAVSAQKGQLGIIPGGVDGGKKLYC
jgi:tRNA-splicing ligase RtcB